MWRSGLFPKSSAGPATSACFNVAANPFVIPECFYRESSFSTM
jgi:hypothetical protein